MTHLSVVIPVYNESSLIDELLKRVKTNVKSITEDYEIIIVDDGSQDNTWKLIEVEAEKEPRIKGIKFSRNFGHHYAITAGIHHSNSDWVVVMDGDLQDRPEVIPELYAKALTGYDVVFVSRHNRPEKLYYRIAQKLFYWLLIALSGIKFDSRQANYSIISKKVADAFKNFPENSRFYSSTIKWLGFNASYILADHGKRHSGKPSYNLKKRFKLASDIILSFSERPLKFAIGIGVLMSVLSFILAILIIYRSLKWGYEVEGWVSLISAIGLSTGLTLLISGIIGIYIGQIFNQVKNRPLYVTEQKVNLL
jgi:dolichol-phosphate mannosyltransferase